MAFCLLNLPVDVCPALQSSFKIAGACFQSLKRIERKKRSNCDSIYITGFYQLLLVTTSKLTDLRNFLR